jgi:uncharacterized protein (TIGR00251 family)
VTAAAAVRDADGGVWIDVKAVPGASRDRIAGWLANALKVQVAAPPERGQANERLCGVLAAALGVPVRAVRVLRGATTPRKTVAVAGLAASDARARLAAAIAAAAR